MTFGARFVIPKPEKCDWTPGFRWQDASRSRNARCRVQLWRCGLYRRVQICLGRESTSEQCLSRRPHRRWWGHPPAVLCALSVVDDDESTEVRTVVANANVDSMTAHSRRLLDDLQGAANAAASGYEVTRWSVKLLFTSSAQTIFFIKNY